MDALSMLFDGFVAVLQPENLLYLVGGVLIGVILGAIPGLSATMAIALVIPLTYYLTPTQSLIMLLAAYNAGTFGGSMSAILIGTPGTVSAAATVTDGYALAKQGKARKAIKGALFSSCFGCLFSSIILVIIAQPIAKVALKFGPAEYAVLMLFSLTIIASAAGKSLTKGLLGGCIGLFFGCVGMDHPPAHLRQPEALQRHRPGGHAHWRAGAQRGAQAGGDRGPRSDQRPAP